MVCNRDGRSPGEKRGLQVEACPIVLFDQAGPYFVSAFWPTAGIKDRLVCFSLAGKMIAGDGPRTLVSQLNELQASCRAKKVGHVDLAQRWSASQVAQENFSVPLRKPGGKDGSDNGIISQRQDPVSNMPVRNNVSAITPAHDMARQCTFTETRTVPCEGGKPGLLNELKHALRRRGSRGDLGSKAAFPERGRRQVINADARHP